VPEQIGVSRETLDSHYLLQIALLDSDAHAEVEREFVLPPLRCGALHAQPHIDDYRDLAGLEVRPPDVHRYVVRVKPDVLAEFARSTGLEGLEPRQLEDEFLYIGTPSGSTRPTTRPWGKSGPSCFRTAGTN